MKISKSKDQSRVIIEHVSPQLSGGKHPISRVVNEEVHVTADVFGDGHDVVQAALLYQNKNAKKWQEVRMQPTVNDSWEASFTVQKQGVYAYKVIGWVDHALNWQDGLQRKLEDGQYVYSELQDGAQYATAIKKSAKGVAKELMQQAEEAFIDETRYDEAVEIGKSEQLQTLFTVHPQRNTITESDTFSIYVDRPKARFSTWYEFFPRSASEKPNKHGTFKDCERLIPRVANMGFDVLYFPPIHPIGEVNRKGKNNATEAEKGDTGSPWGIGSHLGGHTAIHPELGDLSDFHSLIKTAEKHGIEIAMDFALQAAPDHPWVKSNPEWFKWKPDGTVQYAENPPKKYQDILPIHFESNKWKPLWDELLSTALYWVDQGIKIFRVDNPHTKPFLFWGWLIQEVKKKNPEVLFLSEAFTKPKVMQQLGKQGFTQSYTYFTWRNNKHELQEYMHELTQTDMKEYFRPNFWPNTPDINPWELQTKHESIYLFRHFLAATLSSNYGLYGPVYEFMDADAVPGKEEYLNSEKYEYKHWDWDKETKISHLITKINAIRKRERALQQTNNIVFLETENDNLIAYLKWDQARENYIVCVVNLDPYYRQQGQIHLGRDLLQTEEHQQLQLTDLITGNTYDWTSYKNFVELGPELPYHLFRVTW